MLTSRIVVCDKNLTFEFQQQTSSASRGFVECRILRSPQSIFFFFHCVHLSLSTKVSCHMRAVPGNLPSAPLRALSSSSNANARNMRSDSEQRPSGLEPFVRICPFIAPKSETRYARASGGRG